jgi:uncharacterized membrane protein
MAISKRGWTERQVEQLVGNLLNFGVAASTAVLLAGAVLFLARHGGSAPDYRVFRGEPANLRGLVGIVNDARSLSGRGWIQLGLLLLLATPVARVTFTVFAFARQRDWTYVAVALFVLTALLYSLIASRA